MVWIFFVPVAITAYVLVCAAVIHLVVIKCGKTG